MPKKKTVKRAVSSSRKKNYPSRTTRYILIGIAVIALLLLVMKLTSRVHVLGARTGPVLLARGGEDDEVHEENEDKEEHPAEDNHSENESSVSNTEDHPESSDKSETTNSSGSQSNDSRVSQETTVDCVGPDGKHFVASYKDCSELNSKWHISNFTFTPLSNPKSSSHNTDKGEKSETKKTEVQLETHKEDDGRVESELQIESASGSVKIKTRSSLGHETEVESDLQEVNDALKNTDIVLKKSGENEISLIRNKVKTNTAFPIKINPSTNQLVVSLPNGDKEIAILPDEAINRLLLQRVFTSIESEATSSAVKESDSLQTARITELNDEAVFEVRGISQKKVLGIIPVGFAKTAFISTSTGEVVKTDQSFLNSLLERISL